MYTYIGGKIKILGQIIGWILLISGIIAFCMFAYMDNFIFGVIALIYGIIGYMSSWFLYALGQITEDINDMAFYLKNIESNATRIICDSSTGAANLVQRTWVCKNCQTENSGNHSQCKKCGLMKGGIVAPSAPSAPSAAGKAPVVEVAPMAMPDKWVCKNCQTENSMKHSQCKKCGQYK